MEDVKQLLEFIRAEAVVARDNLHDRPTVEMSLRTISKDLAEVMQLLKIER